MPLLEKKEYTSTDTTISREEARRVYKWINPPNIKFNQFYKGMNVELEHQDVTEGSLYKTALIAIAHLKEIPNYYDLLEKYVENKRNMGK